MFHLSVQALPQGFCQFHPCFRGYEPAVNHGKLCAQSPYSHSIVTGTYKHLKKRDFFSACAKLTAASTAKNFRLGTIGGDRCRKELRQVDASHWIAQQNQQTHIP